MFAASRPPLARLLVIDQELRNKTWPNCASLSRLLEVDLRTIHRDIDFMRCRLKAPVEFVRNQNGYHYVDTSFQLPYFQATEGELVAILLGSRLLSQYQGTPFEVDLKRAFERLTTALPEHVTVSLESLKGVLTVAAEPKVIIDPVVYSTVLAALRHQQSLDIDYWSASSNHQKIRRIDPYHLTFMGDDCYLIAHCHCKRSVLMFSMHRIRSCTSTKKLFTKPDHFDLQHYLGKSFRAVRGDEAITVILHFSAELAGRIAERKWHPTQKAKPLKDGGLELQLEVTALIEVMRWVLSWGKDCRVLKPAKLVQLVKDEIRQANTQYR